MVRAIPGFENTRVHRKSDLDTTLVPTTPGMKYRHYAPVNAEVVLVTSNDLSTIEADVMSHKPRSFALLHVSNECPLPFDVDMHQMCSVPISATGVTIDEYSRQIGDNLASTFIDYRISPSNTKDNTTVLGCHLFKALRWLDEYGLDIIYVPVVEEHGTGLAVMNRLYKAASRIIE